jgi:Uma2 family endonuclease
MTAVAAPVRATALRRKQRPTPGGSVILYADWAEYERFLEAVGNRRIFLTYDQGLLEIMAPLYDHEWWKGHVRILLPVLCGELGLECQGGGSVTLRRENVVKGLEADECFWIKNVARMLGLRERLDLTSDPPPDLALEVEGTRSALDRMGVYAALGVPEVWRYDGEAFSVHRLRPDGRYEQSAQSLSFPALPLDEFARFIDETQGLGEVALMGTFRDWVRQHVLPRLQPPPAGP